MAQVVNAVERALSSFSSKSQSQARPTARAVPSAVVWTLRVIVALQCLGAAWAGYAGTSPVGETLFFDLGVPEALTIAIEQAVIVGLIGAAACVLTTRNRVVPLLVAGWFVLLALGHWHRSGSPYADWTMLAHATRYLAPVALALVLPAARGAGQWASDRTVRWLLRGAVASVFFAHGMEALLLKPRFIDYLVVASHRLFDYELAQATAKQMLYVIGAVDVVVAAGVLFVRQNRWLLAWLAFWGGLTAFSRIVFGGLDVGHMTLIRAANGGLPLALLVWVLVSSTRNADADDRDTVPGTVSGGR